MAVIRSLGRLGVPTYAVTEDRWTPAAVSRYCAGRFIWRATGHEEPDVLAAMLREVGVTLRASTGKRCVLVPVDDEAAILIAEHAQSLTGYFLFPDVPAGLPRELASKPKANVAPPIRISRRGPKRSTSQPTSGELNPLTNCATE